MPNFMPGSEGLGRQCRAGYDLVSKHSEPSWELVVGEIWKHPNDLWKVQKITRQSQKKVRCGRAFWNRRPLVL